MKPWHWLLIGAALGAVWAGIVGTQEAWAAYFGLSAGVALIVAFGQAIDK